MNEVILKFGRAYMDLQMHIDAAMDHFPRAQLIRDAFKKEVRPAFYCKYKTGLCGGVVQMALINFAGFQNCIVYGVNDSGETGELSGYFVYIYVRHKDTFFLTCDNNLS